MSITWSNSLGTVGFLGFFGIQIFTVIYMSYLHKVFLSLTNKIQSFQRFKNFQRFRVFFLIYRANLNRRKRRKNQESSFQWQINEWSVIFFALIWLFARRSSKKFYRVKNNIQYKTRSLTWSNKLGKVVYFGFIWNSNS